MNDDVERLREQLRELHGRLGAVMEERWHRSLPFEEELFDRWERARTLGFGERTSIYQQSYVYGDVTVGVNTWIGPFTILDGSGGLTIGDHCSVSAGVQIYTHDTAAWALSGGTAKYEYAPVRIGNGCHIGSHSVIAKGVTIGARCVVGALSFVNTDVPPRSIVVGTPARVVGRVEIGGDGQPTLIYPQRP